MEFQLSEEEFRNNRLKNLRLKGLGPRADVRAGFFRKMSQDARPNRLDGVITSKTLITHFITHKMENNMNHTASPRLDHLQQSPDLVKKLIDISMATTHSGHIERGLCLLVDIRASQLNGCAFCLDMHVKEARIQGERELRLHHLAVWRESPLFTAKERAALAWTEALTRLPRTGISDELYAEVRKEFSEIALSTLTFHVTGINAWNRINVAFRTMPGTRDEALGLDKAGLA
jgi:AhpD family alkylhydroperoxidase